MDTIIIKACLNGGRGREDNPNVPWSPEEVAQEAVRCYEAGGLHSSLPRPQPRRQRQLRDLNGMPKPTA